MEGGVGGERRGRVVVVGIFFVVVVFRSPAISLEFTTFWVRFLRM